MRRKQATPETKFAEIITNFVSDLRFDLEFAGRYLATSLPNLAYRRLLIILEAMKAEREGNKNEYNYDRE